jgi:hypothetical protein
VWLKALVVWVVLLVLAIVNGAFREAVLSPALGAQWGHVTSTVLLSAVVVLLAALSIGWIGAPSDSEAARVGLVWTALVLAFEFLAGHFLFNRSWQYLLADYNVLAGRIWVMVPILTLIAPLLARRLSKVPGAPVALSSTRR